LSTSDASITCRQEEEEKEEEEGEKWSSLLCTSSCQGQEDCHTVYWNDGSFTTQEGPWGEVVYQCEGAALKDVDTQFAYDNENNNDDNDASGQCDWRLFWDNQMYHIAQLGVLCDGSDTDSSNHNNNNTPQYPPPMVLMMILSMGMIASCGMTPQEPFFIRIKQRQARQQPPPPQQHILYKQAFVLRKDSFYTTMRILNAAWVILNRSTMRDPKMIKSYVRLEKHATAMNARSTCMRLPSMPMYLDFGIKAVSPFLRTLWWRRNIIGPKLWQR